MASLEFARSPVILGPCDPLDASAESQFSRGVCHLTSHMKVSCLQRKTAFSLILNGMVGLLCTEGS